MLSEAQAGEGGTRHWHRGRIVGSGRRIVLLAAG
jgi:hypothetical protein